MGSIYALSVFFVSLHVPDLIESPEIVGMSYLHKPVQHEAPSYREEVGSISHDASSVAVFTYYVQLPPVDAAHYPSHPPLSAP
jgi:hypothetical protein